MNSNISADWQGVLKEEFAKNYFVVIEKELALQRRNGFEIYPSSENIFSAFMLTPLENVKVVILGQDPYHTPNMAMGLSFSVPNAEKLPPSLKNIFKELHTDLGLPINTNGDLTPWAKQGVMLLNTCLTVQKGVAFSHSKIGWQYFIDAVLQIVNAKCSNVVFIFWGKAAIQKKVFIDVDKHLILESAHPSPLSAHNGFWGCKHFSKANMYLQQHNKEVINWKL